MHLSVCRYYGLRDCERQARPPADGSSPAGGSADDVDVTLRFVRAAFS